MLLYERIHMRLPHSHGERFHYDTMRSIMNEMLYVGMILVDFAAIAFLSRFGKEWIFGLMAANMILISTFGGKLVDVFGFMTNAGNIFYAAVFLCVFALLDRYGHEAAHRGIWIGFAPLVAFVILAQLAVALISAPETRALDAAIHTVFAISPRILLASVFAYFISLYMLTAVFDTARSWRAPLFAAVFAATLVAQAADSILFFTIAFLDTVPLRALIEIILTGYAVKVAAGIIAIPFLYINRLYSTREQTEE